MSEDKPIQPSVPLVPPEEKEEPAPRSAKRKFPLKKQKPGNNKPYTDKRKKPSFNEGKISKNPTCFKLSNYFELATMFTAVEAVTHVFYNMMIARDNKISNLICHDEFLYVTILSIYYRCAVVSNYAKATIIFGLSDLKTVMENILLPDVIATYVETFGVVKLSSGIEVVPYFRDIAEMSNLAGYLDIRSILRAINVTRREHNLPDYQARGEWSVSPELIVNYTSSMTRMLKNSMQLRKVNFSEMEGRPEFLTVFSVLPDGQLDCKSIDLIDLNQCQLGSAYRFRTVDLIEAHGTQFPLIYGAPAIEPKVMLANVFAEALRAKPPMN